MRIKRRNPQSHRERFHWLEETYFVPSCVTAELGTKAYSIKQVASDGLMPRYQAYRVCIFINTNSGGTAFFTSCANSRDFFILSNK